MLRGKGLYFNRVQRAGTCRCMPGRANNTLRNSTRTAAQTSRVGQKEQVIAPSVIWRIGKGEMTQTLNATRRKIVGEPSAGKSHVRFEVAGGGDQRMGRIFRHSQRKRRATELSSLNARRHSLTLLADAAGPWRL